jgi:hypothetical protein
MMTRKFKLFAIAILLLSSCGSASAPVVNGDQSNSAQLRISIAADYRSTMGGSVSLRFVNQEPFPICFSSNDLQPGYGVTSIRDIAGQILNGTFDTALEEFRGVNLADPLVVLRPGKNHTQLMNLTEYRPSERPLLIQIELHPFRCSQLFDGGSADIDTTSVQKVFRFAEGRIVEEAGREFEPSGNLF